MAHICVTEGEGLALLPLGHQDSVELRVQDGAYTFHAFSKGKKLASDANNGIRLLLVPWREAKKEMRWALVCSRSAPVSVNGLPVLSGLHVLCDRDAISMRGAPRPLFYLHEDPAHVEPLPAEYADVKCRRCRRPITAGDPAVRCPGCGQWYHQEAGRAACWTYQGAKECLECKHSISLDGTFGWTPAGL